MPRMEQKSTRGSPHQQAMTLELHGIKGVNRRDELD